MPGRHVARATPSLTSAARRTYVTGVLQHHRLGPIEQHDHQAFRVRGRGSKLPLPPTLDPVIAAQTWRWQQQKARPDALKLTPFQNKLRANPYAHALASIVRLERSTSIVLPSHFLLTLHLAPHPETQDPWLLPLSISRPNPSKPKGPPIRFLVHKHNAAYLTRKKAHWRPVIERRFFDLLGPRKVAELVWREDMPDVLLELLRDRVVDKLSWYFKWRGRLTPVASPLSSDLQSLDDISCVLCFNSLVNRADALQRKAEEIAFDVNRLAEHFRTSFGAYFDPHTSPPSFLRARKATHNPPYWYEPPIPRLAPRALFPPLEFSSTTWRGRKVALYSLTDLLGEEKAAKLLELGQSNEVTDPARCWVLKAGRQNVQSELLLMQLQTYLAEPGAAWQSGSGLL